MPINIYYETKEENRIDWLCDGEWELPEQLYSIEEWIKANKSLMTGEKIIADIGFSVRNNASGGGGILSSKTMRDAGEINMDIYFSEYRDQLNETDE